MYTNALKYFLAVAKHLNFTKAAAELYIAQPALSVKISRLEAELGVLLFKRTKRSVQLTAAGYVLLAEGTKLNEQICAIKNKVKQAHAYGNGRLTVSILGAIAPEFLSAIKEFRVQYPLVQLTPSLMNMQQLHMALIHQSIDVGITVESNLFNIPQLSTSCLYAEELSLILPATHWFAQKRSAEYSTLAQESFLLFSSDETPPHAYRQTLDLCRSWGFYPKIDKELSSLEDLLFCIAAGYGIAILPTHVKTYVTEKLNLHFIPLKEKNHHLNVVMAWPVNNHNPSIDKQIERKSIEINSLHEHELKELTEMKKDSSSKYSRGVLRTVIISTLVFTYCNMDLVHV